MALKQKIQFLYGATNYQTDSAALAAIDQVQMYPGQPVAAFYGNEKNVVLVIGTGEGKGSNYYKVIATDASLATLEATVDSLGDDVDELQGKVSVLEGWKTDAQEDIEELQGDVEDIQGDVSDLQGDVETAQGDIVKIKSDIDGLKAADTTAGTNLDNHKKQVATSDVLGHVLSGGDVTVGNDGKMSVPELANLAPKESPIFTGTPTAPTAAKNTNTDQLATTKFVVAEIADKLSAAQAMRFLGTIGTAGTVKALPETPATGDTYVAVEGCPNVNGEKVEAGDMIVCVTGGASATWAVVQKNLDGAVTGPTGSVEGHIVTFKGTAGNQVQDSGKSLSDFAASSVTVTGNDGLKGGGALTGNLTISHDVAGAGTAVSGAGANKYVNGLKIDKNGHVTEATFAEVVIPEDDHKVLVDTGDEAGYMGAKFNTATPTADNTLAVAFEVKNHKIEATVVVSEICGGTF